VYGRGGKNDWFVPVMMRDQDWNLCENFTWQVRRSDFDQMMLAEAVKRGATLLRGQALRPITKDDGTVCGVKVRMPDGKVHDILCEVLLDCSGQATWLANLRGYTGPKYLGAYDKQIAIFSQVPNFIRDPGGSKELFPDNTLIFYTRKFYWAWAIPLDSEVVSVGVVMPAQYFLDKKESRREFLLREYRELNPELARRMPDVIKLVEDAHVIPNYSYQVKRFTGKGFICVGDAHRFIDPIFSFGMMTSMKEASFAAKAVRAYLEGKNRDSERPFAEHEVFCEKGTDVLEDMIDTFWEYPLAFATFVHARHFPLMIDILAGRVFERQPSLAAQEFRSLLKRREDRERSYEHEDLYSVPIGSRFHSERAPIWETKGLESTEQWLGPR
jgi:flavin-dependent dehydrogenase